MRDRFDTIVFHDKIPVHINPSLYHTYSYNIIYYHYRNPNSLNAVKHFGYGFCRDLTPASASASAWRLRLRLLTHLFFLSTVAVSVSALSVWGLLPHTWSHGVYWGLKAGGPKELTTASWRQGMTSYCFINHSFATYICLSPFPSLCVHFAGLPSTRTRWWIQRSEVGCASFTQVLITLPELRLLFIYSNTILYFICPKRVTERELCVTVNDLWFIRSRQSN